MRIPKQGEFYRHFKNKLYQIVAVAEHSEDGQKLVIYQALYGDFKIYARPLEMFVSEVDHEKYPDVTQKYRFERIEFAEEEQSGEEERIEKEQQSGEEERIEKEQQPDEEEQAERTEKEMQSEEEKPEEGLIEFLDTDDWDEKYNILVSLRDKMSDKLVDNLAVSMDVVIPEGPLDHRYEELKICLRTRQKYENQRLR